MTVAEVAELLDYWGEHPPWSELVGAYLRPSRGEDHGFTRHPERRPASDAVDIDELQSFGLGVVKGRPPQWSPLPPMTATT